MTKSKASPGKISFVGLKTDKIKSVECRPKTKVKEDERERRKQGSKREEEKKEKGKDREKVLRDHEKKRDINNKKRKGVEYEMIKKSVEKNKDTKVLHTSVEGKKLALGRDKLVETSGGRELKPGTAKSSSDKVFDF